MECEYLSLGLHVGVGNHSRPPPLALISFFVVAVAFRLIGWTAELGPGSYPDFLSFFSLWFFFSRFFLSGPHSTTPSSCYFFLLLLEEFRRQSAKKCKINLMVHYVCCLLRSGAEILSFLRRLDNEGLYKIVSGHPAV